MTDLLNCPFCGSGIDNSHPVPFPVKRDRSVWVARCGNPDCAAEIEAGSPKECTQRWNRRATAAPVVVGEDAAERACAVFFLDWADTPPSGKDHLRKGMIEALTAALAGD